MAIKTFYDHLRKVFDIKMKVALRQFHSMVTIFKIETLPSLNDIVSKTTSVQWYTLAVFEYKKWQTNNKEKTWQPIFTFALNLSKWMIKQRCDLKFGSPQSAGT